jgi:hypothetical protein
VAHAQGGGVGVGNGGVAPPPPGFVWAPASYYENANEFQYESLKVSDELRKRTCVEVYSLAKSFYLKMVLVELMGSTGSIMPLGWMSYLYPTLSVESEKDWESFINEDWDSLCESSKFILGEIKSKGSKISSVVLVNSSKLSFVLDHKHWTAIQELRKKDPAKSELHLSYLVYYSLFQLWAERPAEGLRAPLLILEK